MCEIDMFDPQIKLDQSALNQKFMNESVSFSPDLLIEQEQSQRISKNYKQLKTKRDIGKNFKTMKNNFLQKFFFNKVKVKTVAQKFLNKSYILQNKFKNHSLLREEYLNDQSLKLNDMKIIQIVVPIISFNNKFIQLWEFTKLFLYLYLMWMMPFSGVFLNNQNLQIHDIVLFYLLFIDIGLQLNKEIIVEGQLISDRRIIFYQFMKNSFTFELIYMFCYTCIIYQFLDSQITQILNIIFFFFNLKQFQQCIQNYQESSIIINDKINLIELIITVLMLAHFMACIQFYVGIISHSSYTESWILKLGLQNETVFTQYCYSFYWAATTMVTVGYGDITGQNLYEIICSTILLFFSSGIFAFSMNSIGMILNNINQNGQQYRRNLLLINKYMTSNEVSSDLQVKVRNYLQFYYQSSLSNHQKDVNTVIDQLSQNLKVELMNDVRQKIIQNNSFISKYFSNYTKSQITQKSESINYTPLEQIYQQKSNEDHSLYVISKGFINLIDQNSGRIIQQLKQGDSFGELEFLTEQPRYLSAYSKGFSQILKINRNDFIQIVKQNPQDFEQFHMLKDQILFKVKSPYKCEVCQANHILFECNKIFYKPDIEKVIKHDLYDTYQDRKKFNRIKQKNLFQLSDYQVVKDDCIAYRFDNDIEHQTEITITNSDLDSDSDSAKSEQNTELIKSKGPKTSITQYKQNLNKKSILVQSEDQQNLIKLRKSRMSRMPRMSQFKPKSDENVTSQPQIMKKTRFQSMVQNYQSNADQQTMQSFEFFSLNLDSQQSYQVYYPNNSVKNVIKIFEKFNKINQTDKQITVPSEYRFFKIKRQGNNEFE